MKQPDMRYLEWCSWCRGSGEVMGATMRIFCPDCHGNRYRTVNGDPLSVRVLSKELLEAHLKLAHAESIIAKHRMHTIQGRPGPQRDYCGSNGRGAGGSNFTGD